MGLSDVPGPWQALRESDAQPTPLLEASVVVSPATSSELGVRKTADLTDLTDLASCLRRQSGDASEVLSSKICRL